jgi:hypothetical protein
VTDCGERLETWHPYPVVSCYRQRDHKGRHESRAGRWLFSWRAPGDFDISLLPPSLFDDI